LQLFKFDLIVILRLNCQFDQQLVSYIFFVMTRDALLTSHPVSAEIRDPDDITLYFDAISYDKVRHASDLTTLHNVLQLAVHQNSVLAVT